MENFYYAQINSDNICYAIAQTSGEINQSNMIRIESFSDDFLFKKWNGTDWEIISEVN